MRLKLLTTIGICALGLAMNANAGTIADGDTDLIPDVLDNCPNDANGPGDGPGAPTDPNNQIDTDTDGFGNACDADYDNSLGNVDFGDFNLFLAAFGGPGANDFDHDWSQTNIDFTDFNQFLALFGGPAGNP